MGKLMLIGGGDIGRGNTEYKTKKIDEEIVKITNKKNPTLLFIGLASTHSDSYYDTIKKIYKQLGCNTLYLKKKNIINNYDLVIKKFNSTDIIYIGGGDTIKLINQIKKYHLDELLKQAYEKGCVIAGISAGAILLCKDGFSDSLILRGEDTKHIFLNGLCLSNISICPHYNKLSPKTKELQQEIANTNKEVYCLEDYTALKIIDNAIEVVKSNINGKVFIYSNKEKLIVKEL